MTVTYSSSVSTASIIGFNGLMFRYRGSVWKIIWPEMLMWSIAYAAISFTYRVLLNETWRHRFALFSIECSKSTELVPLTFILGFYVNMVAVRWSACIDTMPYVDGTALLISTLVRPTSQTQEAIQNCRMHRRTLARYMSALHVVTLRDMCVCVFKRFPTFKHIVQSGLLTQSEADEYEANNVKIGGSPYWTIPRWLFARIGMLRKNGMVVGDHLHQHIQDTANGFRSTLMWLTCFDWIPVPLAYTQVVVLAVRTYFLACLFGRQYLDPTKNYGRDHEFDIYIPPFTVLQFVFYVGWLKVAEVLINPMGEDDDDFEMNHLCDSTLAVATASFFGFNLLMFRWKGSIWQLIWHELLIWCFFYAALSFLYRMILYEEQRLVFARLVLLCEEASDYIPLTFILGFYVSIVADRWRDQIEQIPFPDETAMDVVTLIRPKDKSPEAKEECRLIRRNLARYSVVMTIFYIRNISSAVFKRFPTIDHLRLFGLASEEELDEYKRMHEIDPNPVYMATRWALQLLTQARKDGLINSDFAFEQIHGHWNRFRVRSVWLACYDWIPVPLAYTQVVTIAVRAYFFACLFGRQYLDTTKNYGPAWDVDIYIPPFTILQFISFVGWMKVADVLINPLGEDDEDFDMNHVIDRSLTQSLAMVDGDADSVPALTRDIWWDKKGDDIQMPYTQGSEGLMNAPHIASVEEKNLHLTEDEERVVTPSIDEETSGIRRRLSSIKSGSRRISTIQEDENSVDGSVGEFSHDGDDKDRPNIDRNRSFGSSLASLSIASFFGLGNDGKASRTALNNFDKEKAIETIHEV